MLSKEKIIKYSSICVVGFVFLTVFTIYNISSKNKSEYTASLSEFIYENSSENLNDGIEFESYSQKETIFVEIKGEVQNPDVYEVEKGSIVKDLINLSGGLTQDGDVFNINQARELISGECIIISSKQDINSLNSYENQEINRENVSTVLNANMNNNSSDIINVNTASKEELKTLNGVGDTLADAIIAYREQNGNFKSVEDLMNVNRIGAKTIEKLRDKIKV